MRIIHITRRGMALSAAAVVMAVAGAVVLAGCFAKTPEPAAPQGIPGATDEERVAYLTELGWEVEPTPLETLDLQLPEDLSRTWGDYAALQEGQGLPFGQYAGQAVRRYTYTVLNYPGIPKGCRPICMWRRSASSAGTSSPPGKEASRADWPSRRRRPHNRHYRISRKRCQRMFCCK